MRGEGTLLISMALDILFAFSCVGENTGTRNRNKLGTWFCIIVGNYNRIGSIILQVYTSSVHSLVTLFSDEK